MGEKKLESEPNETGTQVHDHQAWCEEKHGMEFGESKTDPKGDDDDGSESDKSELSYLEKKIAALKGKRK